MQSKRDSNICFLPNSEYAASTHTGGGQDVHKKPMLHTHFREKAVELTILLQHR